MEDFKDVMLSEPPQRYTSNAPAATSASNALSLESYKGILLCDRPADTRTNRGRSELAPFLPPGNTDMDRGNGNLGLQPSIEARSKVQLTRAGRSEGQRPPKNPALSRHRQWLVSFAGEIKKMQESKGSAEIRESMRKTALREREAAKRRNGPSDSQVADEAAASDEKLAPITPPAKSAAASGTKKAATKKGKSKPKWAMTEEEAEEAEFAEARDLVDFAAELDYEGFIKDFEVQEALAIMRDRVKEIAAEKGIDLDAERAAAAEYDDDDAASVITTSTTTGEPRRRPKQQSVKRSKANAGDDDRADDRPGWDESTNTAIRKALQGDALKLAERVLQSSDALRKVHSKMSMAKLLQDVAMEVNAGTTQRQVTLAHEAVLIHPRVAIVAAEATGNGATSGAPQQKRVLTDLRQSKSHVQNLPYLYRCPSI